MSGVVKNKRLLGSAGYDHCVIELAKLHFARNAVIFSKDDGIRKSTGGHSLTLGPPGQAKSK